MNIEHIIISGGGPIFGLYAYGVLNKLQSGGKLDIDNVKTICGCSSGAILGALMCLKYDWNDLSEYIICRPWDKIVDISPEDLFRLPQDKGILDRGFFEEIFNTLLQAKDLGVDTTLAGLYAYSGIDLHVYTAKVNSFEYVDMSHETHPDVKVIDAVYMSSAIPFIFKPVKHEDLHYADGAIIRNYPFDNFRKAHISAPEDTILGIYLGWADEVASCNELSLLDYALFIYRNQLNLLDRQEHDTKYSVRILLTVSELTEFVSVFKNSSMRDEIINKKSLKFVEQLLSCDNT